MTRPPVSACRSLTIEEDDLKLETLGGRAGSMPFAALEAMPDHLAKAFAALAASEVALPGPDESFSPVEQVWHLADLEREGYALRIRRMLDEAEPALVDFDGAQIAVERNYRTLPLANGLEAFGRSRRRNVGTLRGLSPEQWARKGTLEGVGKITLCDLASLMVQHDEGHRREIAAWLEWREGRRA